MKRLLYLAALSMVTTLLLASVALAQASPGAPTDSAGNCAAGQQYVAELNGCIPGEGLPDLLIGQLNSQVLDADTGEPLGLLKDVDQNLAAAFPYENFCAAFPTFEGETAQEYFDGRANAQERAILDPDGNGIACDSAEPGAEPETMEEPPTEEPPTEEPPVALEEGMEPEGTHELPDTGGPALLVSVGGLMLMGAGLAALRTVRRR